MYLRITKDFPGIEDDGERYVIRRLFTYFGAVYVNLDKPLWIEGKVVIQGDLTSNVPVVSEGSIILYGVIRAPAVGSGNNIAARGLSIKGDVFAEGDVKVGNVGLACENLKAFQVYAMDEDGFVSCSGKLTASLIVSDNVSAGEIEGLIRHEDVAIITAREYKRLMNGGDYR